MIAVKAGSARDPIPNLDLGDNYVAEPSTKRGAWQDYASSDDQFETGGYKGISIYSSTDERDKHRHASMAVHPTARINERKVVEQYLPIPKRGTYESGWNDETRRRLHEIAAERIRTARLCSKYGYVWRRLASMVSGLRCVWLGLNR